MHTRYADIAPYVTLDGSTVRELVHPTVHGNRTQSLAEAVVPAGAATRLHWHQRSEEIYHITAGIGVMTLGKDRLDVRVGDSIYIAPGTRHCIENIGRSPLHILCCCSPAYSHDDTHLV